MSVFPLASELRMGCRELFWFIYCWLVIYPKKSLTKQPPFHYTSWFYESKIQSSLIWVVLLFHVASTEVIQWYFADGRAILESSRWLLHGSSILDSWAQIVNLHIVPPPWRTGTTGFLHRAVAFPDCSKNQEVDAVYFFRAGPENWHRVTSVILHGSWKLQNQPKFKERGHKLHITCL